MENFDTNSNYTADQSEIIMKIILVAISVGMFVSSRYGFLFFISSMLPSFFLMFIDMRNSHKCLSATVFSFNLIGVMPYIITMWSAQSIDLSAKEIISDFRSWFVIYIMTVVGYLFYVVFPILISKFYIIKLNIEKKRLIKKRDAIVSEWNVEPNHKD